MLKKSTLLILTIVFLLSTSGCSVNLSNSFPQKPVTLIVPAGTDGGGDMQARALEKIVGKYLGGPLVVLNKPGNAGIIGLNKIKDSPHDGYFIGLSTTNMLLHSIYHEQKLPYIDTFEPIAQITSTPFILVVDIKSPWHDVASLIACAKKYPKEIRYGHGGIGSSSYTVSELFAKSTGTVFKQAAFHSGNQIANALPDNYIQFAFLNPAVAKERIEKGTLRAIAVTSEKRMTNPLFKDLPTLKESGVDVSFNAWKGIVVPKDLPLETKRILEYSLKQAIADPSFKTDMQSIGLEVQYLNSEQSQQKWAEETKLLKKTLENTGVLDEVRTQAGSMLF